MPWYVPFIEAFQFADFLFVGYLNMDVLLPEDDSKPQLLQPPQRQSSTSVRSPFLAG
jgi:hypothetical protein